ncbi:hypothetical protein [Azospirillum soli]|uniref:hypothetical protein n=1 Tax=Azospirillum soli TaxID=1304799 RepID=UPI001AE2E948|nr:hypothetical protein [Azospirillum soli]MBP2312925.1 hypothetical protein [Azospirillum soli]
MTIDSIYTTLAAQGNPVTLDDASLGTTGLDAVLTSAGLPPGIRVTLPGPLPQPQGERLRFSGTSGFLAGTEQCWGGKNGFLDGDPYTVDVTIAGDGQGDVSLTVAVELPDGWVLGDGIYAFTDSPFTADVLSSPSLSFAFNTGTAPDGVTLAADAHPVGPLVPLDSLVAWQDPARASGLVTLDQWGPTFTLATMLGPVSITLVGLTMSAPGYRLGLSYVPSTDDAPTDDGTCESWMVPQIDNLFVCDSAIVGQADTVYATQIMLGLSDEVTLQHIGDADATPAASQNVFLPLFPTAAYPGDLTSGLFTERTGIASFGVASFGVTFDPETAVTTDTYGTLGITTPWHPVPGLPGFVVDALNMTWVCSWGDASYVNGAISALLSIGAARFSIEVEYPSMSFAGNWLGDTTLDLGTLNSTVLSVFPSQIAANPDLLSIGFGDFGISLAFGTQTTIRWSAMVDADVELSGLDIAISGAMVEMAYDSVQGSQYALNGMVSVENWVFGVTSTITADRWDFAGQLLNEETLSVSDVVYQLLGNVATPDEFDMTVTVRSFSAEISSGTGDGSAGRMAVAGAVAWDLVACGVDLGGDFSIAIHSADSGKSWAGTFGGDITVAGLDFAMTYEWGPQVGLLDGSFTSGGHYDWMAVAGTFDNSQPSYPADNATQPNLRTGESLAFTYDFERKVFTITGSAASGDVGFAGFYQQVPTPGVGRGYGFAAGVQFTVTSDYFSKLASCLHLFDTYDGHSFGLSAEMAITYANFRSGTYRLPIQQAGAPGVYPGITFTGSFSWTDCQDSTTNGAMGLMTRNRSAMGVVIGFYNDTPESWLFQFDGTIQDIAWNLGPSTTVNSASVGFTMNNAGYYEVLIGVDVTLQAGSGYVEPPSPYGKNALDFIGQLLFVENTGAVSGSAAIFMTSTWHEPFGIPDLTVGDLGLLLGIGELAGEAVPSFGLTGFLAYPPGGIEAFLTIYFNGASPRNSLFIGSISNVPSLSFADMLKWAANISVPSLMLGVLKTYGAAPIPLKVESAATTLTDADFAELNAYRIPDDFRALVSELGYAMGPDLSTTTCTTQVVVRKSRKDSNSEWFVADYQTGYIFHLIRTSDDPPDYTLSIDPWLYVVPSTTKIGTITFAEGYGFGAQLSLPGMSFDVYVKLHPMVAGNWGGTWGLSMKADSDDPFVYPLRKNDEKDGKQVDLLVISAADDPTKGPSVCLATYQDGDVPPHFDLDAAVALLKLESITTKISILENGLSFHLGLSLKLPAFDEPGVYCGVLDASMTCLLDNADGFSADFPLSVDVRASTDPVKIDGVVVIPAIKLDTGMGLELAVSFPLSTDEIAHAHFKGSIGFSWGDQSFKATIAFSLDDLNHLTETIGDWVVANMEALLDELLRDTAAWARAIANGLFWLGSEAAAEALKALGAAYGEAVDLMAQVAYTADDVYDAIKSAYDMTGAALDDLRQAVTDAFCLRLNYGAVAQMVGPATPYTDPSDLIAWLQGPALTDYRSFQWSGMTQPSAGATVAVTATLLDSVTLDITLADPGPYAARFRGLGLDTILPYQRLSDTRGVFSTSLSSTTRRTLPFGPFQYQFPEITLSFYTDGAWELNFGYPEDGTSPGSTSLSTPAYGGLTGQGGFKLYNLAPGTTLPGGWKTVSYACGVAASMSMTATGKVKDGLLSGSWSLTYTGGFNAVAGYGSGYDPNAGASGPPAGAGGQPAEFQATLTLGYAGALYGTVDFGLVSAAVHVSIGLTRAVTFTSGSSISLTTTVKVHAGAKIRIRIWPGIRITISFSYTADVDVGTGPLPWSLASVANDAATAMALARPIPWARAATAQPAPTTPLTLWFLPELTLAFGDGDGDVGGIPQVLCNLAIQYDSAQKDCAFNALMRTLLQWALAKAGTAGEGRTASGAAFGNLSRRLRARPRLTRLYEGDAPTTQLAYGTLVEFFQDCFTSVTVVAVPGSDGDSQSAVSFAMIPDLISCGGATEQPLATVCDFATYNQQPVSYEADIETINALFQVPSGDGDGVPVTTSPESDPASLATYAFLAYFEYLLKSGSDEALRQTAAASLDQITADQWNDLTFDQTASGITVSFRGGVRLSRTGQAGKDVQPLYALTGQQTPVSKVVPAGPNGTWATGLDLTVAAGAGGGWITVAPGVLGKFTASDINAILGLTVQAKLTLDMPAKLTASNASYVFATFASYTPAGGATSTLATIPSSLAANPGTVTLQAGTAGDTGTPLDATIQWGSLINVTLRKLTLPDGSQDTTAFALAGLGAGSARIVSALADAVREDADVALTLLVPTAGGRYADGANPPADTILLRTILSMEEQPAESTAAVAMADGAAAPTTDATFQNAQGVLDILVAYSQTNATGYYLTLGTADAGLTALFSSSDTAEIAILALRGQPQSGTAETSSVASDTVLFVARAADALNSTGLYATSSTVLTYQPAFAPGVLPVQVTRPNPDPTGLADDRQTWLNQLYSPFAIAVSGDAYADLGYAPPCSPSDGDSWTYVLSLPLNNLLAAGPSDNPYASIGTKPTVTAQLRDSFGNAIAADLAPFTAPQTYTDLLVGPASWTGSQILWSAADSRSTLTLTLSVDKATLDTNRTTARPLYETASWQLSRRADVEFRLSTSLDDGPGLLVDATGQQAIMDYVDAALSYLDGTAATPPDPVTLSYPIAAPTEAMPPVSIAVTLTLWRIANLDADDVALLPGVANAAASAAADLSAGLTDFAKKFQEAFPDLALASGTDARDSGTLWAVAAALVNPTISDNPTYFAPAPAYTSLQSGTVPMPQYTFSDGSCEWGKTAFSSVDCDQLLQSSFAFVDQVLGGPYAAAAYKASVDDYRRLVSGRAALGELYADNQLRYLFANQAGTDPAGQSLARNTFADRLQNALANAYAIDGVLNFPATWGDDLPDGWRNAGLSLWGLVTPGNKSTAAIPTSARLTLSDPSAATATLAYLFQPSDPTDDATLSIELAFQISHVAVAGDGDGGETWLALAIPVSVPIGSGAVSIPVIDRFFPAAPSLDTQTADSAPGTTVSFDTLFRWTYGAELHLGKVAQDTTDLTITYNLQSATTAPAAMELTTDKPQLTLAEAVVQFQAGSAQIGPALPALLKGDSDASAIVAAMADLVDALRYNATWNSPAANCPLVNFAALPTSSSVTATTLTIRMEAVEDSADGAWTATVKAEGLPVGTTMAATVLNASDSPRSGNSSGGPLIITFHPAPGDTFVDLEITLSGLDVRLHHNASASAVVTRNSDVALTQEGTVMPDFILTTPEVAFPQPIAPLIVGPSSGYDIASIVKTADKSLRGWLASLLTAIAGTAIEPRTALILGYRFAQYSGTDASGKAEIVYAVQPVTVSRTVVLADDTDGGVPLDEYADALAASFDRWVAQQPALDGDGQLVVTAYLFATVESASTALIQLPNLFLPLDKVSAGKG